MTEMVLLSESSVSLRTSYHAPTCQIIKITFGHTFVLLGIIQQLFKSNKGHEQKHQQQKHLHLLNFCSHILVSHLHQT